MHPINLRNLFCLFGRKIIIVILALSPFFIYGQRGSVHNPNYQQFNQNDYYFGFTFAINNSRFRTYQSNEFLNLDSIKTIHGLGGSGFNVGIVSNLKMGNYFDFRFLPTLSFAEKKIKYQYPDYASSRKVESVFVELPFQFRYKSEPFHDVRLFLLAGLKYSFDVASDSRTKQAETLVRIAPNDFAFETGVGFQIFLPFFIFSPELKFSQGMGNTLIYNKNLTESTILEKILSRTFTISLHFEG
jgi:hypothetical protein